MSVFGLRDAEFDEDAPEWSPVPGKAFACRGPWGLGYAPGLRAALAQATGERTVLHLQGLWKLTSAACLSVSEAYATPRVISPRGMLDAWALGQSRVRKRIARWLYEDRNLAGASCIHTLCEAEARQVRSFGLRNPVAVVANGVDLPEERAGAIPDPAPADWRDRRVVLFLSRVHRKKGLPSLIRGWAGCACRRDGWALAIAGPDDGGHAAEVQQLVAELGLTDSVSIVGGQYGACKDAWLRRASVFVLPSQSEGFPMSLLEALAYGLPAIMTPDCNFPQAQEAGAAVCAHGDPASLGDAVQGLTGMGDRELSEMGKRGRDFVAREYTWRGIAGQMTGVYEWLLGEGPVPECVQH